MAKQPGLLTRSLRYFLIMAVILLSASIPVYYFVIESIWMEELDEKNAGVALQLEQRILNRPGTDSERMTKIAWLNETNADATITVENKPSGSKTRYFTAYLSHRMHSGDLDRFRIRKAEVRSNGKWYVITTLSNIEEEGEIIGAIALVSVFFLVVLFAGFLVLNALISKKIWKPFHASLRFLQQFSIYDDQLEKLPETAIREFSELNYEINQLLAATHKAYRQQREFLENAAHELQTPIAVLNSRIQLRQQQELTPDEALWVQDLDRPLQRLNRINKNLLLLAKIENHQFRMYQAVNLDSVVQNTIELFEDYVSDKNLTVIFTGDETEVPGNELLCETAVGNLISNAIKFSENGSKLQISVNADRFVVSNPGTESLDAASIGKRFYKGINGETGLGLSIVAQICALHSWRLIYSHHNGKHEFTIFFR